MNIKNLIAVAAITASAMVSTHSFADTNITENVTLTADTDWSGLGLVTIESGVTVELSGCKLSLDGLAGEGSIVTNAVLSNDLTNPTDAATAASTTTNGVPVKMTNDLYPAKFAFNDVYADATGQAGGMLYADNFSTLKFVEIILTGFPHSCSSLVVLIIVIPFFGPNIQDDPDGQKIKILHGQADFQAP